MGSPEGEAGRFDRRERSHEVTLTRGFWLGEVPCTQELWESVTGENPSRFKGPRRPVERVSWDDVQSFLCALGDRAEELVPRLPSEAEWEYACRAGTTSSRHGELDDVAWWSENSGGETHVVGEKAPNAWGFRDMLGNVYEWCEDAWADYAAASNVDPLNAGEPGASGGARVIRGGAWHSPARGVRAAYRFGWLPGVRGADVGFRLARGQVRSGESSQQGLVDGGSVEARRGTSRRDAAGGHEARGSGEG